MANEKRLIDANALKERINEEPTDGMYTHEIIAAIDEQLTVDAVEVVRCKDCKHCKKYRNRLDPMLNHQLCVRMDKYAFGVDEDDFCSYGERRTE